MSSLPPASTHTAAPPADFTASDGCRLNFDDPGGPGRPVVLLHAWGLNSGMWQPLVPRMQREGLRPITIDRRGHGASDRPQRGYDLHTLVADVIGIIDHLGLADVAMIGHSLGAAEAAAVAARDTSGRITSLVLSATTTPCLTHSDTNPQGVPAAMFETNRDLMRADMASWVTENTAGYWGSTGVERPIEHVWTQQALFSTPARVLLALHETMTGLDLRDELASITMPVLVVHGTDDLSSPPQITARPTAELVPGAHLHLIEGAGHGLYASHTDEYLSIVVAHLHGDRGTHRQVRMA